MPTPASLRRLALADVDEATLRDLIEHGEDQFVEKKLALPAPPGFGAEVAAFANTLGGWVLLGVRDDGSVAGWEGVAPKTDLQSHLGAVLRAQVDPLPPFVAAWRELDGKRLAVVRVFESADAPHIVRPTGALYVRTAAGKEPIRDQGHLLALARRGIDAEVFARRRVERSSVTPSLVADIDAHYDDVVPPFSAALWIAPLTVTPQLRGWPISKAGRDAGIDVLTGLLADWGAGRRDARVFPLPQGWVAKRLAYTPLAGGVDAAPGSVAGRQDWLWGLTVAAESSGVYGAAINQNAMPMVDLPVVASSTIAPLLGAVVDLVERAEGLGRAVCALELAIPAAINGEPHQPQAPQRRRFSLDGELTLPADDSEQADLVRRWELEVGRTVGIEQWEE